MTADEWHAHICALPSVQTTTSYGYRFYFVGEDHRLPFATIADSDNEYERVSKLDRPGVFRLNIGVRRETFLHMFPEDASAGAGSPDCSALDVFMPHPDYAKQHFICVLNPAGDNIERTRELLLEAHAIADARRRP